MTEHMTAIKFDKRKPVKGESNHKIKTSDSSNERETCHAEEAMCSVLDLTFVAKAASYKEEWMT